MKEGWKYKKIKDVGEVIAGTTPSTSNPEFWGGDICWISPAELHGEHYVYDTVKKITPKAVAAKSLKELPEGTVILSSRAPIGKIAINKVPMYCNQGFKCVVCGPELFNEFLYWWFYGKKDYLNSLGTGATFPEISKTVVENIVIPVAPMNEQLSIVSRLDAAFAHIDSLKANAEKQLAEARQLFQAELAECMRQKEGWEEKTLPDISENLDSIRVPVTKKNRTEGKYPYYGASGIVDYVDNYLFDEDLLCVSEDGANLLMRTNPIAFPISGKVWVNNHAHVLRFKSLITQKYVEYYFSGLKLDEYITGAAQPKLTQKALNSIIINIPQKIDIQRSIASRLDALSANIKKLEEVQRKTLAECDALKQAMLREVFE